MNSLGRLLYRVVVVRSTLRVMSMLVMISWHMAPSCAGLRNRRRMVGMIRLECSIARFTGTMKGPMVAPGGPEMPPTGKAFDVDDVVGLMKQIGLGQ
jgi:hypothetical protein